MPVDMYVKENLSGPIARAKILPCDPWMTYDTKAFVRRLQEAIDDRWPASSRPANDRGQARLAELTGLPQGQISHMLSGKREPRVSTIATVADKLVVSLDWLVFGTGQMKRSRVDLDALAADVRDLRASMVQKKSETPPPLTEVRVCKRK